LEHGGAAPVIIAEDANLDSMLPLLAKGGFYHADKSVFLCNAFMRIARLPISLGALSLTGSKHDRRRSRQR